MTVRRSPRIARAIGALCAVALMIPGMGSAHGTSQNGFSDRFETLGPLQGDSPTHPYEIRGGTWKVEPGPVDLFSGTTTRVLVQHKLDTVPTEPIAFVREREFSSFTAEVTAGFYDKDTVPGTSLGMVFRAPVFDDGSTDRNNMYFFGASITGPSRDYPTGKTFTLFKRFGGTWFPLTGVDEKGRKRQVDTWADLTMPHTYKVVMTHGWIQAFVDGRLVIEHRDFAAGDNPTSADPLPGLPYDRGTVGLRTAGTRAFFDNFSVVGNDAYEGRAMIGDLYGSLGQGGGTRQGTTPHLSSMVASSPANRIDTGFRYHDHDGFDDAIVRPLDDPAAGPSVRTYGSDGTVTSTARANGVAFTANDPDGTTSVTITADAIEATANASCSATSSAVHLVNARYHIRNVAADGKVTEIGPSPIRHGGEPNTVLFEKQDVSVRLTAHKMRKSTYPRRIEATGLLIEFLEDRVGTDEIRVQQVPGGRVPAQYFGDAPILEIPVLHVVAGRYCS